MPRPILHEQARAGQRAIVRRADAASAAADLAVRGVWADLLRVLRDERDPWRARQRSHAVLQRLFADLADATRIALVDAGLAGHALGRLEMAGLPLDYLRRAVLLRRVAVREDEGDPPGTSAAWDYLLGHLGIDDTRRGIEAYLFAPPTEATILRLLNAGRDPWNVQLARVTRLASPDVLAQVIGTGYALGKTQRQIAADLLPALNNVRVSARRIARTEGVRIGHALQMRAHEALGDLVIAYTIHSAHVPDSRHWHVRRDGTTYYRNPGPGQLGFDRMPRPPAESPDPRDRPVKAPAVAPNCLCWLTPVPRPL